MVSDFDILLCVSIAIIDNFYAIRKLVLFTDLQPSLRKFRSRSKCVSSETSPNDDIFPAVAAAHPNYRQDKFAFFSGGGFFFSVLSIRQIAHGQTRNYRVAVVAAQRIDQHTDVSRDPSKTEHQIITDRRGVIMRNNNNSRYTSIGSRPQTQEYYRQCITALIFVRIRGLFFFYIFSNKKIKSTTIQSIKVPTTRKLIVVTSDLRTL